MTIVIGDQLTMQNLKTWTKPVLDVTPIKLAEYYVISGTDNGQARNNTHS